MTEPCGATYREATREAAGELADYFWKRAEDAGGLNLSQEERKLVAFALRAFYAASETPRIGRDEIIESIVCDVCELPDYTSPPERPDELTVSVNQLRAILDNRLPQTTPSAIARKPGETPRTDELYRSFGSRLLQPADYQAMIDLSRQLEGELAPKWPNPDDWNLICPKCGASPDGTCGWRKDCPTGLNKRDLSAGGSK